MMAAVVGLEEFEDLEQQPAGWRSMQREQRRAWREVDVRKYCKLLISRLPTRSRDVIDTGKFRAKVFNLNLGNPLRNCGWKDLQKNSIWLSPITED